MSEAEIPGSAGWREARRLLGNASESGALMDCSPWFPRTPFELWLVKSGRSHIEETGAMRRGIVLEPLARRFVEDRLEEVFEPRRFVRDRLGASLDGLSFDGRRALELKCPGAGRESETWQTVVATGAPPLHYYWQVQQQLYCSGAEVCHFAVCHSEGEAIVDALVCDVTPDGAAFERLESAWAEFLLALDSGHPPPRTPRDVAAREDLPWQAAVERWRASRRHLAEARQAEAAAREALIGLAGERSAAGAGVRVTRYWKKGEIDWRKATSGLDLEPFRREGSWHYRISEQETDDGDQTL